MADELGRALDSRMDYIIRGNEDSISPPPLDLLFAEEISKELVRSILTRNAPGMENEIRADATEDFCNSMTSSLAHHDQGAPLKTPTVTFSSDPALVQLMTENEKLALPSVTPRHSTSTEGNITMIRSDQSLSSIASMVDTTSRNDIILDSRGEAVVRRPVLSANGSRLFSASSMTYSPSEVTSRATPEPHLLSANSTGHFWSGNSTGILRQASGELESLDPAGLASDLANAHLSLMPSSSIAMGSTSMSGNGFPVVSEDSFLEDLEDNAALAAKQITSVSQEMPQVTEGEDQVAEAFVDWLTDDAVFSNELHDTLRGSRTASVRTLATMITDDGLTEPSSPTREARMQQTMGFSSVLHAIDDNAVDDNTVDMLTSALISEESPLVTDGTSLPPAALSCNRGWTQETKDFDSMETPVVESSEADGMGPFNGGWSQATNDFQSLDVATDADLENQLNACWPTEPEDTYDARVSIDGSQASFIAVDSDPSGSFSDITADRLVPHVETYPECQLAVASQQSSITQGHAIPEGTNPFPREPLSCVDVDTIPEASRDAATPNDLASHAFAQQEVVPRGETSYSNPLWKGRINDAAQQILEEPVRYGCPLEQHMLLEQRHRVNEETSALDRTTLQMLERPSIVYEKGLDTSLQSRAHRVLDGATYELLVKSGNDLYLGQSGSCVSDETLAFNQGAIAPLSGECDLQETVDKGNLQVIEHAPVGNKVSTKDVLVAPIQGHEDVLMDSVSATLITDDGHSWFDDTLQMDATSSMAKENHHLMGTSTTANITGNSQSMSYSQLSSSEKEVRVQQFGNYVENSTNDIDPHEPRLESLETRVLPFEHDDVQLPLTRHQESEPRCEEDPIIKDRSYSFSPYVPTEATKLPEDNLSVDFDLESIDAAGAAGSRVLSRVTSPLPNREAAKAKVSESGTERDIFGQLLASIPIQPSPDDVACRCASLLECTSPWSPHPPATESTFAFRRRVLSGKNRPDFTIASREEPEHRRNLFVADEEKSASHSSMRKCEEKSNVVFSARGNLFSGPCDTTQASNEPLVHSHNASEFLAEHASLLNDLQIRLDSTVAGERKPHEPRHEQNAESNEFSDPCEANSSSHLNVNRIENEQKSIAPRDAPSSGDRQCDYSSHGLPPCSERVCHQQLEKSELPQEQRNEVLKEQERNKYFPSLQRFQAVGEQNEQKDCAMSVGERSDVGAFRNRSDAPSLQPPDGNALVAEQVSQVLSSAHVDYDEPDDADVSVATIGDIPNFLDVEVDEEAAGLMRAKANIESQQSLQTQPRQLQALPSQRQPSVGQSSVVCSASREAKLPEQLQPGPSQTRSKENSRRDPLPSDRIDVQNVNNAPSAEDMSLGRSCLQQRNEIGNEVLQSARPQASVQVGMDRIELLRAEALQNAKLEGMVRSSIDTDAVLEFLKAEADLQCNPDSYTQSELLRNEALQGAHEMALTEVPQFETLQNVELEGMLLSSMEVDRQSDLIRTEALRKAELQGELLAGVDSTDLVELLRGDAIAQLEGAFSGATDRHELRDWKKYAPQNANENSENLTLRGPQPSNTDHSIETITHEPWQCSAECTGDFHSPPLQGPSNNVSEFRSAACAPLEKHLDFHTAPLQGHPVHLADDRLCNQINDRSNDAVVRESYREHKNAWADVRNPAYTDLRNMCNEESGIPYDCLDHFTPLFAVDDTASCRSEQNSGPFHWADGNNLCAQIGDAKPVLLSETIISESMIMAAQSIYRCETQEQAFESLVKMTTAASLPEWLGSIR